MSAKLTFLFVPVDAVGHFNACIGIAGQLRDRGYKVVFATPNNWKGKLEAQGFLEECYTTTPAVEKVDGEAKKDKTGRPRFNDKWGEMISGMAKALKMPPDGQAEHLILPMLAEGIKQQKFCEPIMRNIVAKVKPDVIVVDGLFHSPALMDAGIPWILSVSLNSICISNKNVPPAFSGFPIERQSNPTLWKEFEQSRRDLMSGLFEDFKSWVIENGGPELKYNYPHWLKYSPYANIYMCPIELDYTMFRPNPPKWHRFDTFVRTTDETFEIPEKLQNLEGKLIYLSMGTIGSSELSLMQRLVNILTLSPHRFIVSKGPLADKYDLADNMWGAASVPQTKIIPMVDLVITHGGNNTITESFYFGTPVLVLPLFCDQWDNARRIEETGLGRQFLPYTAKWPELNQAIENLLKDDLLLRRMKSISKRIQASNDQSRAADLIEYVGIKYAK